MTSVVAETRSAATSADLPTPASPQTSTMCPGSRNAWRTAARCPALPT